MAHNARVHYEKLLNVRDARVHYYYSLLERYMKHVFAAGLVTGDFLILSLYRFSWYLLCENNFCEGPVFSNYYSFWKLSTN